MLSIIKNWYRFLNPSFQTVHLDYRVDVKPRYNKDNGGHPKLLEIINRQESTYKDILSQAIRHTDVFSKWDTIKAGNNISLPQWENGFFPALDMICLYTMVSHYKPNKVIEIGSGNSTKVVRAAINNEKLNTTIESIDPQPRAEIDELSDQIIRKGLEECDISTICQELHAGDILFIDNSHRILPNSDAMVVFTELLPNLKKGVIVHIHDIYIPYDYPQFMCDRYYSEQYGLMIAILSNPDKYKALLPVYYISQEETYRELLAPIWELPKLKNGEKHGGSFWFTIAG